MSFPVVLGSQPALADLGPGPQGQRRVGLVQAFPSPVACRTEACSTEFRRV